MTDFATTESGTIAQLSATISVENSTVLPGAITLVRTNARGEDTLITLRPAAEDALLALLLARKGISLAQAGVVACERHGGAWGDDETCERCTDDQGAVRPVGKPGSLGPGSTS